MNKRSFIKKAAWGSMALASLPWMVTTGKPAGKDQRNWVWMTPKKGLSPSEWKQALDHIKSLGFDAVLFEAYNSREARFETDRLPMGEPVLEILIEHGNAIGLEVHAWMFTMPCSIPEIVENHTDWYAVNGLGQPANTHPAYVDYYKFLSPSHPEAMEFVRGTVKSLASMEGLTGVHLDYIRLPDVILAEALQPKYNLVQDREFPEYDYCYHEVTRKKFKEKTGIDPLKDLEDPSANESWRQFRQDLITDLVNNTFLPEIKKHGKEATAAVFPNWQHVRQEWRNWNLDGFFPMLYHNFYNEDMNWIGKCLKEEIADLKNNSPIYSGLFVPELDAAEMEEAFDVSFKSGAAGIALFNYWNIQPDHEKIIKELTGKSKG
ncbi:Tat pathway signal protein [Negadavirga shengliensis]|uniref:Tat pathway signal protein n=1 Tax=Negadavirga shengliensis TaxID=1389218 RepID=A0ABV9SVS0_9BACT